MKLACEERTIFYFLTLCGIEGFGADTLVKEFATKEWNQITPSDLLAFVRITAEVWLQSGLASGVEQTQSMKQLTNESLGLRSCRERDAILNVCCNNGCNISPFNIFTLNFMIKSWNVQPFNVKMLKETCCIHYFNKCLKWRTTTNLVVISCYSICRDPLFDALCKMAAMELT